jgi:endonuclease YncB( thermonuclease family)
LAKTFQLWVLVIDWVDGDTLHGVLDHGCFVYHGTTAKPLRYRCAGINAPELDTPQGRPARDYAHMIAPPGEYPCISTGIDTYGRPLIDLILPGGMFSSRMIDAGFATVYRR